MAGRSLAALVAFIVLAACSAPSATTGPTESAPSSISVPPSPSPTTESEPTGVAGPPSVSWEATDPFEGQPTDIFVDGATWVAGGWAVDGGPAAWTSKGATSWMAATVADPLPDAEFHGAGLGPIVRLGDSLLSYGTAIGCCDSRGVLGWRSADGADWEVIESTSPLFEKGYLLRELAVGTPAVVAVEGQYVPLAGRIWRWTQETSWEETTPRAAGEATSLLEPRDVIWSGEQFVVVGAKGQDGTPTTAWSAAVLVSADGETWEDASVDGGGNVTLMAVARLADGRLVAYGDETVQNEISIPRVFVSADGSSWTAVDAPFGETRVNAKDLIVVEGGLLAIGSAGFDTHVWFSADGREWSQVGTLEHEYAAGDVMGDQLVLFTTDHFGGGYFVTRGTVHP